MFRTILVKSKARIEEEQEREEEELKRRQKELERENRRKRESEYNELQARCGCYLACDTGYLSLTHDRRYSETEISRRRRPFRTTSRPGSEESCGRGREAKAEGV